MSTYKRRDVERMVPGIWDEWRVLEKRLDEAPDPDMPKAPGADPRRSTDPWAALADMQRAWKLADLTLRQRQAVLLIYGLDYTQVEAGETLGCDQTTAMRNAEAGIGRLLSFLNGVPDELDLPINVKPLEPLGPEWIETR